MLPDMRPDFGKNFFEKHQSKLVRFANSWIGRRFFDFKGGFGLGKIRVMALYPNAVSYDWKVKDGKLVKTTCFSTDNHYQKKLEHAYRFVKMFVPQAVAWKMLQPSGALSLLPMVALTTSTFYPDAAPESTSVDGYVGKYDPSGTWDGVHDATTGTSADDSGSGIGVNSLDVYGDGEIRQIDRVFLLFDTSSIDSGDAISSAVLSLYVTHKSDTLDTAAVRVVTSTPASNTALVTADYDAIGTVAQATDVAISSISTTAFNDWTFNSTGRGNVDKDGISKFGARIDLDADDTEPTDKNGHAMIRPMFADNGSNKPKLVVEHSAPGPANLKSLNAVAKANIKSVNGVALANIKSING